MLRRLLVGSLAAVTLVVLSGCSSTPTPTPDSGDPGTVSAFVEYAIRSRAEAVAAGASDEQLAIIDSAIATGEITLEQAQDALANFGGCLEEGGLRLTHVGVTDVGEFTRLDYRIEYGTLDTSDDEAEFAHMVSCEDRHFRWVDMLYQSQPAATEATDAAFLKAMPALIECLQAGGVPVADDALPDEVKGAMSRWLIDHQPRTQEDGAVDMADPMATQQLVVLNCLGQAGLDGY